VYKPFPKYLILAFIIILTASCRQKPASEAAEGKIKFAITYEQSRVGGYSVSMLPKEMTMEFSNNMVRNTIEGGLGFFNLVNVSDLRHHQHTTWLKFIDKRYIFEGERKESPCCFGMLAGMEFKERKKEIAGLHCMHVIASFPGNGIEPFDIWYTEELDLVNPNSNSPFIEIPGVLLEFNTFMGNANMHMLATSYDVQHIPQKQFQPPKEYRPVTKGEMESILNALMN